MRKNMTIGLVVPTAEDRVPDEGAQMYPDVTFIPRGVGVRSLTPEGYAAAFDAIVPAAEHLAAREVDAIMVIGTSLTFYRGPQAHDRLMEQLRARTGLPVEHHEPGGHGRPARGRRPARGGGYRLYRTVNQRLKELLAAAGIETLSLEALTFPNSGVQAARAKPRSWRSVIQRSRKAGRARRHPDLMRGSQDARRGETAGGPPRHPGRGEHPSSLLGGAATRRRERADFRLWPDPCAVRTCSGDGQLTSTLTWRVAMKARVTVTLKTEILDPQGKAIEGALKSLGIAGVAASGRARCSTSNSRMPTEGCGGDAARGRRQAPGQCGDRELSCGGAELRLSTMPAAEWPDV